MSRKRRVLGVNRKRVQRLMRTMGIEASCVGRRTTRPQTGHKIYPYLLRNVEIRYPDHVWSTDITYIPLRQGFLYLVAIIDWFSRHVLSWRLSNTLDGSFCLEALDDALSQSRPEVFNSDQGSQFTSVKFTGRLISCGVAISMDGRGRALDNVFIERLWRLGEVRGHLPARLCGRLGSRGRTPALLSVLQRTTDPSIARVSDAVVGVSGRWLPTQR